MNEHRTEKRQRTIDISDADIEFVANFMEQVKMLAGLVKEMVKDDPRLLLSPVMRQLLIDKAREVESMRFPIAMRGLLVDNPCDDLKVESK